MKVIHHLRNTLVILISASLAPCTALKLAIVSKIIVDEISGTTRPGGGGVQAAAGARLASLDAEICLHAPVGCDFDASLLAPLEHDPTLVSRSDRASPLYRVNTSCVTPIRSVATTPGEIITYRDGEIMDFEQVGWDSWDTLCAWEPPELSSSGTDAVHVIVEGGGSGEVRAVLKACDATSSSSAPCVGIEPILHEVTATALDGLRKVTRLAVHVSPDLATAACIGELTALSSSSGSAQDIAGHVLRPADVSAERLSSFRAASAASASAASAANGALVDLAAACFDELCLQPGCVLAIRDGAFGSYLYTRPSPNAPAFQWLADANSREFEWLAKVPAAALDHVVDPTGAGNAYAGALTAQLAAGVPCYEAAAVASAVGGAFCAAAGWAPNDAYLASRWVERASADVRGGIRVVAVVAGQDQ